MRCRKWKRKEERKGARKQILFIPRAELLERVIYRSLWSYLFFFLFNPWKLCASLGEDRAKKGSFFHFSIPNSPNDDTQDFIIMNKFDLWTRQRLYWFGTFVQQSISFICSSGYWTLNHSVLSRIEWSSADLTEGSRKIKSFCAKQETEWQKVAHLSIFSKFSSLLWERERRGIKTE